MSELKVSVVMITYGHENFIEEAINGVLTQKCDFKVELIIANDHSPDNTDEIIKKVLKNNFSKNFSVNYIKRDKNWGIMPNFIDAVLMAKGKYIALCEGDDYWTDPLKLQEQVDFLNENSDYGLVHSNFEYYDQREFKILANNRVLKNGSGSVFNSIIKGTYEISTLTTCFRQSLFLDYIKNIRPLSNDWMMGDLPIWLYMSKNTKIYYSNKKTAIYRILAESASNTRNIEKKMFFEADIKKIKLFILNYFSIDDRSLYDSIQSNYYYRKLVINNELKGSNKQFFFFLYLFYRKNSSFKLFLGSIKQIFKKIVY